MVALFAVLGALVVGVVLGLLYRGYIWIGDRRELEVLTAQMAAEQRISALTHQTLSEMRRAAAAYFRGPSSE
jgi:hypothetical protein